MAMEGKNDRSRDSEVTKSALLYIPLWGCMPRDLAGGWRSRHTNAGFAA